MACADYYNNSKTSASSWHTMDIRWTLNRRRELRGVRKNNEII